MGIVFPADQSIIDNIVDKIVSDYPEESLADFARKDPEPITFTVEDFGFEKVDKDGNVSRAIDEAA